MTPLQGVTVTSLPTKTSLLGLDNAFISFQEFEVTHESMLSRFSSIDIHTNEYILQLPPGVTRMVDLLISRLLTGRIVLSEFTSNYALFLFKHSYDFTSKRMLWKGKKEKGTYISELPLFNAAFTNYSRSLALINHFIANTRDDVVKCIKTDKFTHSVVEKTCVCKFVGTSFAVDCASVLRKLLGSQALFHESYLGSSSFVCNATCAAEGDNTIMELKIVQDMVRGRTSFISMGLFFRSMFQSRYSFYVLMIYLAKLFLALVIFREKAIDEGQLLKDIAWCKAHLLIIDNWVASGKNLHWIGSYYKVLVKFPMPTQC